MSDVIYAADDSFGPDDLTNESMLQLLTNAYIDAAIEENAIHVTERRKFWLTPNATEKYFSMAVYYTFKPNANLVQLESHWDTCLQPVLRQLALLDPNGKETDKPSSHALDNLDQAILILTGLFDSSTPRMWKEENILENNTVQWDELPPLDPKWVRRNSARVFSIGDFEYK